MASDPMSNGGNGETRDRGGVQVVERATRILHALRGQPAGLSLAQIADRVDLPRSTVHRLIAALEAERLVVAASPNGRFRLGPSLITLGLAAQRDIALEVHRFLVRLSREVDETVDLAVLERDEVLFVDQVAAPHRLRAVSSLGSTFPAYCTANGKALLAELPSEEVELLLPRKLPPFTPNTVKTCERLLVELDGVRATGIAYDREEHTIGICAVGTVIRDPHGQLAAITVPLPAQRFPGKEERLVAALLRGAREIERSLATGQVA
jgi:DNA-binding IclR family transcriptional regulator